MLNKLSKFSVHVILLVLLGSLSGCVGPIDLLLEGMAESQMTPEGLGISAANYRGWDCNTLNLNVESFEKERLKADDKRPWQWHIDAMNQIRTEKNCAGSGGSAVQQTNPSPTANQSVTDTPVISQSANIAPRNTIGINMVDLTPAIAESMKMKATSGVAVVEVIKGLSAEKVGIKPKDIITEVAGQSVSTQQQVQDILSNMKLGYMADIQILRNKTRKAFKVKVISSDKLPKYKVSNQSQLSKTNTATPNSIKPEVATGPIVYSYCWYTTVENRKHWTSSVFSLVQTPSVNQTSELADEFRAFLDSRYHLGEKEGMDTICQLFDTQAQATKAWDKTRKIYRFDTVENNEIDWKPAN
ncbi:MAG: PDZ domain-containing protein [Methylotenera sp.]|nr:PDZ domain-containing protein [Methylotenera sp.]